MSGQEQAKTGNLLSYKLGERNRKRRLATKPAQFHWDKIRKLPEKWDDVKASDEFITYFDANENFHLFTVQKEPDK